MPRGIIDRDPTTTAAAVDDEEHQRALEEQWMSGMTGLDEAATAGSSGEGKCLCLSGRPFLPSADNVTLPPAHVRRRSLLLAPQGRLRGLLCPVPASVLLPDSGLFQKVRRLVFFFFFLIPLLLPLLGLVCAVPVIRPGT